MQSAYDVMLRVPCAMSYRDGDRTEVYQVGDEITETEAKRIGIISERFARIYGNKYHPDPTKRYLASHPEYVRSRRPMFDNMRRNMMDRAC